MHTVCSCTWVQVHAVCFAMHKVHSACCAPEDHRHTPSLEPQERPVCDRTHRWWHGRLAGTGNVAGQAPARRVAAHLAEGGVAVAGAGDVLRGPAVRHGQHDLGDELACKPCRCSSDANNDAAIPRDPWSATPGATPAQAPGTYQNPGTDQNPPLPRGQACAEARRGGEGLSPALGPMMWHPKICT